MNTKTNKLALAIAAMVMAGSAMAATTTDTANLTVSATVENACAISAGALAFGTMKLGVNAGAGTLGTQSDKNGDTGGSISVVCTTGASATITAGMGLNGGGTARVMKSAANDLLAYELYTDSGRGTVLGTPSSGTGISYTGTGSATTTTDIFGRILGANIAAAPAGTYADTVAMVITYTP